MADAVQTTFAVDSTIAYPGTIYDASDVNEKISKLAAAAIPFGVIVCRGANDGEAKVPAATGDVAKAWGVALKDETRERVSDSAQYAQYDSINIGRKVRVWMTCETAWAAFGSVFVRFAATVNGSQLGAIRNDADTISSADSAVALSGAKFLNTGTGAGLALVELNL